jgi:hypothetical protein
MFSGLPPIATHARTFWIGSLVPEAVIGGWLLYEKAVNSAALFLWEKMMEQPANTSHPLVGTWKLVSFLTLWRR